MAVRLTPKTYEVLRTLHKKQEAELLDYEKNRLEKSGQCDCHRETLKTHCVVWNKFDRAMPGSIAQLENGNPLLVVNNKKIAECTSAGFKVFTSVTKRDGKREWYKQIECTYIPYTLTSGSIEETNGVPDFDLRGTSIEQFCGNDSAVIKSVKIILKNMATGDQIPELIVYKEEPNKSQDQCCNLL